MVGNDILANTRLEMFLEAFNYEQVLDTFLTLSRHACSLLARGLSCLSHAIVSRAKSPNR